VSLEVWTAVIGLGAILGGAALAGLRWAWSWSRKVGRFLDSWFGHDGAKSMPERMTALETRVGKVEEQWTPNGGGSALDSLKRVESMVKGIAVQTGSDSTPEPPKSL